MPDAKYTKGKSRNILADDMLLPSRFLTTPHTEHPGYSDRQGNGHLHCLRNHTAVKLLNATNNEEYGGHAYNLKTKKIEANRYAMSLPDIYYKIEF